MKELKTLTIKNLLARSAELFADNPCLSKVNNEPLSYAEVQEKVREISLILQYLEVKPGDRVAILGESTPNWGIAYFSIVSIGAIVVPILPDFHSSEIHHIIRNVACKVVFVSQRLLDKIADTEFKQLKNIILIDKFYLIPHEHGLEALEKINETGEEQWEKVKKAAYAMNEVNTYEVLEDDLASIIFTSGTSGHSKGVMLTHKNIVFDAIQGAAVVPVMEKDRFLSILPLSHTYECTIGFILPILVGASIYFLDKPPTARVLLPAFEKVKPTYMLSIPLVIEKIFKTQILPKLTSNSLIKRLYHIPLVRKKLHRLAGKKLLALFGGKLRFFGIGGAPLSPETELFLREAKFPYAIGYGLTETAPLVAASSPQKTKFRAIGPALQEVEIKIDAPDPMTGEGEIFVKGANVMKGYYKDPERTNEVFTSDGWFKTGDLGLIDAEGYLFIKGRSKNMILGASGENIYPEEIEAALQKIDYVLESLVFQRDSQIEARIYLDYEQLDLLFDKKDLSDSQRKKKIKELLDEIRHKINANVSSYSRIHKIIEQRDPFEKTPTQKIKRYLYSD